MTFLLAGPRESYEPGFLVGTMLILPVPDPRDGRCPLPSSEDRRRFLFLGTWSRGTPDFPQVGLPPGWCPFRSEDVHRLLEIYEEIQFDGDFGGVTPRAILAAATASTPGRGDGTWPYLTPFYFTARNRAIGQPFGEVVGGLLAAAEELGRLLEDPGRRSGHFEHLRAWDEREQQRLSEPPDPAQSSPQMWASLKAREGALRAIQDPTYVSEALRRVREIEETYLSLHRGGHPVVYALAVPEDERTPRSWRKAEAGGLVPLRALPPEVFEYRIDLPPEAVELTGPDPEWVAQMRSPDAPGRDGPPTLLP
jgi:hypothetical protein